MTYFFGKNIFSTETNSDYSKFAGYKLMYKSQFFLIY